MKKHLILLLIASLGISVFYSCKKEVNGEVEMQSETTSSEELIDAHTAYEWEIYYKLQDFKLKMEKLSRSSDPMTLTEAEWYMETNFNVDEARTEEPYRVNRKDTTYYILPINSSGLIEFTSINSMYNEMLDDLDSIEIVISDPDVIPIFARLELQSSSSTEADFLMVLGWGEYFNGNYEPFLPIDDWYYGNMLGRADGAYLWESDAGQELINRLNNPYFQWATPGSFVEPRAERNPLYDDYPDVNNQNPNPDVDYMIFYEVTSAGSPILEDNELTFYLNRMHEIIYTYSNEYLPNTTLNGQRPTGLAFEDISVYTPTGVATGGTFYEHRFTINYATRVNIPLPD